MGAHHRLRTDGSICIVSPGRMNCPVLSYLHGAHVHLSGTYDCDRATFVKKLDFGAVSISAYSFLGLGQFITNM